MKVVHPFVREARCQPHPRNPVEHGVEQVRALEPRQWRADAQVRPSSEAELSPHLVAPVEIELLGVVVQLLDLRGSPRNTLAPPPESAGIFDALESAVGGRVVGEDGSTTATMPQALFHRERHDGAVVRTAGPAHPACSEDGVEQVADQVKSSCRCHR